MEFESPHETQYARKSREEYRTEMDEYECKRCGYVYDAKSQDPPDDATFYWVPSCPYCNAPFTSNPITETSILVGLSMYRNDEEGDLSNGWLDRIQAHARHLHGREVHEFAGE